MKNALLLGFLFFTTIHYSQSTQPYSLKSTTNKDLNLGTPEIEMNLNHNIKFYIDKATIVLTKKGNTSKIFNFYDNNIVGEIEIGSIRLIDLSNWGEKRLPAIQFITSQNNGMGNWESTEEYTIILDLESESVLWNNQSYHFTENYDSNEKEEWQQDISFSDKILKVKNFKGNPNSGNPKGVRTGNYEFKNGKFNYTY